MSFSINESKVEELVRASNKGYELSTSDLPPMAQCDNFGGGLFYVASGATYNAPILVTEETKAHFAALRRQIEESGVALKSTEELTREIDEMRGRR